MQHNANLNVVRLQHERLHNVVGELEQVSAKLLEKTQSN